MKRNSGFQGSGTGRGRPGQGKNPGMSHGMCLKSSPAGKGDVNGLPLVGNHDNFDIEPAKIVLSDSLDGRGVRGTVL